MYYNTLYPMMYGMVYTHLAWDMHTPLLLTIFNLKEEAPILACRMGYPLHMRAWHRSSQHQQVMGCMLVYKCWGGASWAQASQQVYLLSQTTAGRSLRGLRVKIKPTFI